VRVVDVGEDRGLMGIVMIMMMMIMMMMVDGYLVLLDSFQERGWEDEN
jgi:predicted permease